MNKLEALWKSYELRMQSWGRGVPFLKNSIRYRYQSFPGVLIDVFFIEKIGPIFVYLLICK